MHRPIQQIVEKFTQKEGQRAVLVKDSTGKLLAGVNSDALMPSASVLKMLLAHIWTIEYKQRGELHRPWVMAHEILRTRHPSILTKPPAQAPSFRWGSSR